MLDEQDPGDEELITSRLKLLKEAIEELDAAILERKQIHQRFRIQIDKEADEVLHHLSFLPSPWKEGYHPEMEAHRVKLHKSLTSRKDVKRAEELKRWEQIASLMRERRSLLMEYQLLLRTKERLKN